MGTVMRLTPPLTTHDGGSAAEVACILQQSCTRFSSAWHFTGAMSNYLDERWLGHEPIAAWGVGERANQTHAIPRTQPQ